MNLFYMFLFFIIGVCFGAVFNKIGKHLPDNEKIFKTEKCDNCGYYFPWYERIPLLSYFACSGRCSMCNTRLDTLEVINELFTGLLFTFAYVIFGISYDFYIALGIISLLMIVVVSDLTYYIIPDEVLIGFDFYFILMALFKSGITNMLLQVASGLFLFIVMYLIMVIGNLVLKKESLGGGDIKMMFTFGLILGPVIGLFSIFVSSCIALPVSLLIMHTKGEKIIPFGPFLLVSLLLLYFIQLDTPTLLSLFKF